MNRSLRVKAFSFLFSTACDAKSTKGVSINILAMWKIKQTHPVCLHAVEKYEKVEGNNIYRTITKQQVENEKITFQDIKFKIAQKN